MTDQQDSGDSHYAGRQAGGPGRLVRDARLRRDMTVDQVAEALHLDRRIVEQLEADDFDALPPLTFVRGYLRAYCNLLDLDPAPVIDRLADAGVTDAESPLKAHAGAEAGNTRTPRPVSRGPGFLGLALSLAVLIAGVVAIAWWLSRSELPIPFIDAADEQVETAPVERSDQTPADRDDTSGAAFGSAAEDAPTVAASANTEPGVRAPSDAPPAVVDAEPSPAAEGEEAPEASEVTEAPEASEVAEAPEAPEGEEASEVAEAPEAPEAPETSGTASPPPDSSTDSAGAEMATSTTAESGADASGNSPAQAPELPVANRDELIFRFSGDSWMEVTDGRGERLLFGIAESGEERLSGEAPFDIVIGNTRNVTLEYRNEKVDLEAYARGNVARFTLGGS